MSLREEKAQDYWVASRQWRGDNRFGTVTVGELLKSVADLAGTLNSIGWARAENHAANLLDMMIRNKRCRKSKPINNVIRLNDYKTFQSEALPQEMFRTGNLEDLAGLQVPMKLQAK